MRASASESAEYLGGVGCLDAFEPLVSAPTEGAVVIKVPPREAIRSFGAANHSKYCPFLEDFYLLMAEPSTATEVKPHSFGFHYPDVVSDCDARGGGLRCGGQFDGQEQSSIQAFGAEVLFANGAKLHGFACGRIHVPLHPSTLEVLGNHTGLHGEFAYRGTKCVGATLIQVEGEEGKADIVSGIRKVAAESAFNQGVEHWSRARSAMAKKFPQRAQIHFAWPWRFSQTLHSCALKVLNRMTVLFDGFGDGRSPSLKTTICFENGKEGFTEIMACLWKVLGRGVLRLTWVAGSEKQNDS